MFAELRTLRLGSSDGIRTPLLVPSFSSKGFGRVTGDPVRSEISEVLEFFAEQLTESFLVSAYDLHARLLEAGDRFAEPDWSASPLSRPEVLFLDSGGYEVRVGADSGELAQDLREPVTDWDEDGYRAFLDSVPEAATNIAAVSWDREGVSYNDQLEQAQALLGGREKLASVVLLKPTQRGASHELAELEPAASRLAAFAVIGVTEHELGGPLLKRVEAVMQLREILYRAKLDTPIHIFGALDPLYVPLYFAAGADIFDGLTWLRYAYWHGLAMHREQGGLLDGMLEAREDVRRRVVLAHNLNFLGQLQTKLQRFVQEGEWDVFSDGSIRTNEGGLGERLRDAYLSAMARRA
jgi:hypothetical protein